jgi:hypothetical protein
MLERGAECRSKDAVQHGQRKLWLPFDAFAIFEESPE